MLLLALYSFILWIWNGTGFSQTFLFFFCFFFHTSFCYQVSILVAKFSFLESLFVSLLCPYLPSFTPVSAIFSPCVPFTNSILLSCSSESPGHQPSDGLFTICPRGPRDWDVCVEAGVEKMSVRHKICLIGLNERDKLKEEEKRGNVIFYISKLSVFCCWYMLDRAWWNHGIVM